jgi:hypothetical protein
VANGVRLALAFPEAETALNFDSLPISRVDEAKNQFRNAKRCQKCILLHLVKMKKERVQDLHAFGIRNSGFL